MADQDYTRRVVRDSYDRWSETYDTDANKTRDLDREVTRGWLELAEGADVLELGCGTGKNTELWAGRARRVIGLDFSEGMLERARQKEEIGDNVEFRRVDLTEGWGIESASADVVTAQLVLEHIAELEPIFAQAFDVLREGGRLLVSELHPFRQYLGSRAEFSDAETGEGVSVPAFIHEVSAFVNTGLEVGFELVRMAERRESGAEPGGRPRLLTLEWVKETY